MKVFLFLFGFSLFASSDYRELDNDFPSLIKDSGGVVLSKDQAIEWFKQDKRFDGSSFKFLFSQVKPDLGDFDFIIVLFANEDATISIIKFFIGYICLKIGDKIILIQDEKLNKLDRKYDYNLIGKYLLNAIIEVINNKSVEQYQGQMKEFLENLLQDDEFITLIKSQKSD